VKTRGKVIISIILIFGLILGGGAWWVKKNLFDEPFVTHVDPTTGKTIKAFNVLLLGSDARPNEKKGRTDAIIVVQVSQDRISMLSIPRDTRVDIPGHGKQKINAAAYFEKPEDIQQRYQTLSNQLPSNGGEREAKLQQLKNAAEEAFHYFRKNRPTIQ
jgi:anionic cell wall polymer biosynthesis LytR-Cps2A-Psr (LCP) family protein